VEKDVNQLKVVLTEQKKTSKYVVELLEKSSSANFKCYSNNVQLLLGTFIDRVSLLNKSRNKVNYL
jgi:hypothetical protein